MGTSDSPERIRRQFTTVKGRQYERYVVDLGRVDGKRRRRSFADEASAQAWLAEHDERQRMVGQDAALLDRKQLRDAVAALEILGGQCTLTRAAEFYVRHVGELKAKLTVAQAVELYLEDSLKHDLRDRSIKDLRLRLGRFARDFGPAALVDVTSNDARTWVRDLAGADGDRLGPVSRRHYKVTAGGLYNWAIDNGYAAVNPFERKSRSKRGTKAGQDASLPEIITPREVRLVMNAAECHRCATRVDGLDSMVPAFAIGFFAGIRTTELTRLDWADIDLDAGLITVTARIAKKRSQRHVDIQPNLLAWLAPYRRDSGPVTPSTTAWRPHFEAVRDASGIERWPQNCMRHCFATYHLALFGDANKTALQLGHRSVDLLFNHYRNLATMAQAREFFDIRPSGPGEGGAHRDGTAAAP